jgi:hypothetical protein
MIKKNESGSKERHPGRKDAPALPDGTADVHVKADEALQSVASAAARVAVRPAARPFEQ